MSARAAAQMRQSWNRRAEKDAFYYVETTHWDGDADKFFALGEERAAVLIDPVLSGDRGTALDIGCGLGRMSRALASRFERVVGVDVSDQMIAQARKLNADLPSITFLPTDGLSYAVEDGSQDFVFSYEVFQHMPSHEVIRLNIEAVGRALRARGAALIHMKIRPKAARDPVRSLLRHAPGWALSPIKRVLGKDPLTIDDAYRGADPFSTSEVAALFANAGMEVVEMRADPTHAPGTHVLVHAKRK